LRFRETLLATYKRGGTFRFLAKSHRDGFWVFYFLQIGNGADKIQSQKIIFQGFNFFWIWYLGFVLEQIF